MPRKKDEPIRMTITGTCAATLAQAFNDPAFEAAVSALIARMILKGQNYAR